MDTTFLIQVPYYWGRGIDLASAKKEARKAGYRGVFPIHETVILSFPSKCKPYVDDIGRVSWIGNKEDMTVIHPPKTK